MLRFLWMFLGWFFGRGPQARGRDSPAAKVKARKWDLDRPVFHLTKYDILTLRDICENVIAFGRVGAGKTSCLNALAYRLLAMGAGGLILCVKQGEAGRWRKILEDSGRPFKCIGPNHAERLDLIGGEYAASGGYSANIANLFTELMSLLDRRGGGQDNSDPFWKHAAARAIGYAVDIVAAAGRPMTAMLILDTITSAPSSKQQEADEKWRSQSAYFIFAREGKARKPHLSGPARQDFDQACGYFGHEWLGLAAETRSSILANITAVMGPLNKSPLREMFTANPTVAWDYVFGGGVLICDLSIHSYGFAGQLAQVAIKFCFQKAALRRADPQSPAFIWADECQEVCSPNDVQFASVSRECRVPMVWLTQNVSNLHLGVGGEHHVKSLLGNMKMKFMFSSDDGPTTKLGCDLAGREIRVMASGGKSFQDDLIGSMLGLSKDERENMGWSEQYQPVLEPTDFSGLATGGRHGFAEAIVFVGGRILSSGHGFIKVALKQS